MKVNVVVKGEVSYMGTITMSKKDYAIWCDKVDGTSGSEHENVAIGLIAKMGLRLSDPSDWGTVTVDTFERVKEKS